MPKIARNGRIVGKNAVFVSDITYLLELRDLSPKPLETIQAWILNPVFLAGGKKDWQTKRIVSIWRGTWWIADDLQVCTRANCEDGEEIIVLWNKPDPALDVEWVQIM